MTIRTADAADLDRLATIWHDGWRDGHLAIVPEELARVRTLENFRERLEAGLADVRVIVRDGVAAGFYMLKGDELYQFYVAAESRGSGIAGELMADAEATMAARGGGRGVAGLRGGQRSRGEVLREARVAAIGDRCVPVGDERRPVSGGNVEI